MQLARYSYTHIFDLIWKIPLMLSPPVLAAGIIDGCKRREGGEAVVFGITCFVVWGASMVLYYKFTDRLPTYLYAKLILHSPIKWSDAKVLGRLFYPDRTGLWHPMIHVRHLPLADRRNHLLKAATTEKAAISAEDAASNFAKELLACTREGGDTDEVQKRMEKFLRNLR